MRDIASLNTRPDHSGQDSVAKFEIDIEGHIAAIRTVGKGPDRFQMLERTVQIFGQYAPLSAREVRQQSDPAAKPFAKQLERNHQIGLHHLAALDRQARADAGGRIPRQKLGVTRHIRHKVVHLARRVGQETGFVVARHGFSQTRSGGRDLGFGFG